MKPTIHGLGLLCLVGATACASALTPAQAPMANLGALKLPAASDYPKADSVTLFENIHGQLESHYTGETDTSRWLHHQATLILTEAGLSEANYRISVPKKAEIHGLRARTVTADGAVYWLDPSQVHKDEGKGSEEDSEYEVKVFAFPQAAVGAVLEVQYRLDYPWIPSLFRRDVAGKTPIEHYRVLIEGPKDVYYRVMSYNSDGAEPWKLNESDGHWALSWEMKNIKPMKEGSFMAPYGEREPHWAFSVQAFVKNGQVYHRNSTWDNAVRARAKSMYHDTKEYYEGFDSQVDVSQCGPQDLRCKITTAQAWLTDNLPMRGFQYWPGRDAKEVMNSGEASNIEKARILYRLLKDLKIDARYALYHPYLNGTVDEDFPQLDSLIRTALVIRKQGNLSEDLWIDPACEYCDLGELPHWMRDTRALVVDYTFEKLATKPKYSGAFEPVRGQVRPAGQYVRHYHAQLEASGDAQLVVTKDTEHYDAQVVRQRVRSEKSEHWQEKAQEFAKDHLAQATVQAHEAPVFTPETWHGHQVMKLKAPGLGVRDGDALVVPLNFLGWFFDDRLKSKKRGTPLVIAYPYDLEEVATLTAPAGWVVKSLPTATTQDGPFLVTIQAASDRRSLTVKRTLKAKCGEYAVKDYAQAHAALDLFRSLREQAVSFAPEADSAMPPGATARP